VPGATNYLAAFTTPGPDRVSIIRSLQDSEELVRRILDAVPGGIIHVALDGSFLSANAEARRLYGLRFDDVTKRFVFQDELVREDRAPFPSSECPAKLVLTTGTAQGPITVGVRKADGSLTWADLRAEPLREGDGTMAGAILTALDVTDRKRLEEERQRTELEWRVLVENMPDFVVMSDRQGNILSTSRVHRHLDKETVLRSSIFDFIEDAWRDDYRQSFARAVDLGEVVRTDVRGQGPDGAHIWYEAQLVPIAERGEITRVLIVSRDVTERRALLAGLAEKERLASVGMLAASVAHEIMNPLTYVLANLDFVVGRRSSDPERNAKAISEAREGARRMQQIVWDLRALGRAGGEELFYVDARSVIEIALRLSGPEVSRSASVVLELGEVPCVLASESRLCQVFINLLVNAAQAMVGREDRQIRVTTRHDEEASLVAIAFSDTGPGIPADSLTRIFDPFYTTKPTGTGLGLSICRDIVERMGGRIDVASALGAGTTFTVWLSTERVAQSSTQQLPE
jgi:PAS domain S-box-containing protein